MPIVTTTGVNYEPPQTVSSDQLGQLVLKVDREGALGASGISTLHLNMQIDGEYGTTPVSIISAVCGSGCRAGGTFMAQDGAVPMQSRSVEILRFAKAATVASGQLLSRGMGFASLVAKVVQVLPARLQPQVAWLVTMEDGHILSGSLSGDLDQQGQPRSTAKLTLRGKMIVEISEGKAGSHLQLFSRDEPVFEADVTEWPPKGAILRLTNGPVHYYTKDDLFSPNSKARLIVKNNTIAFGNSSVKLLEVVPEITEAVVTASGVRLAWSDTRHLIPNDEPQVTNYVIYRKYQEDTFNGWHKIATVPATVLTFVDGGYAKSLTAEYIVLHAATYPFGYLYESLLGTAITIVRPSSS
jgi:hypothetical protein